MKDALKTLIRVQKFNIDELRKRLNVFLTEESNILDNLHRINDEFAAEKEFAKSQQNPQDFAAYMNRYLKNKDSLIKSLLLVQKELGKLRDLIADEFKKQKTFEIVDNNRKTAAAKAEALNEGKMLDEIGTNAYIKKHKSEQ